MNVKEMLERFNREETDQEAANPVQSDIEALMIRMNKCFVEIILPGVFEVENDLNQAGYWNLLNVGQASALSSGKPNIKSAELIFRPERIKTSLQEGKLRESAYKARFTASGNLRKVEFRMEFPKRIPPGTEIQEKVVSVENIDTQSVNAFLEAFIHGALEAYRSDRMLA